MKTIGLLIVAAASLFALLLVSTVLGCAAGWAVGLIFSDAIFTFLTAVGMDVEHLEMYQVGASLGFIGGFFRSTFTGSRSNG